MADRQEQAAQGPSLREGLRWLCHAAAALSHKLVRPDLAAAAALLAAPADPWPPLAAPPRFPPSAAVHCWPKAKGGVQRKADKQIHSPNAQRPCTSGAYNLFDAMSDTAHDGASTETAVEGGEDRIGALPDDLLRYIMEFLPSRNSVQTCVLARRWRTLWKSVPALFLHDPETYGGVTGSSTFVDELLRLRDKTPLNVCDISSQCEEMVDDDADWDAKAFQHMKPWLEYAVSCQVQELTVTFPLRLTDMKFISSHLKRLEFNRMWFEGGSLVLFGCKVLQVLQITTCEICAHIMSSSLECLYIDDSKFDWDTRTLIYAPNLVDFRLDVTAGLTPFIFPTKSSLAAASVILSGYCVDSCDCEGNLWCEQCRRGEAGDINKSIVLDGLSRAKNLELLLYEPSVFIFRRDLKFRPMFSKLKTLLLNDWCVDDDFTGLAYFLQHAPILETLTVQLDSQEKQRVVQTDESYNSSEQSFLSKHIKAAKIKCDLSKHLKAVKIKCDPKKDATVHQILKILRTYGVPSEKIDIQ